MTAASGYAHAILILHEAYLSKCLTRECASDLRTGRHTHTHCGTRARAHTQFLLMLKNMMYRCQKLQYQASDELI